MANPARSLEEIKALFQQPTMDLEFLAPAIVDLCDHLIAQKAEINANKAQQQAFQNNAPTLGQIVALGQASHL